MAFSLNCHATGSEALRDSLKTAVKVSELGLIGIGISNIGLGRLMVQASVAT